MRVTEIVELSKSRSKVYIENEFAFVLYKGEFRLYHVKAGEELSEEDYRKIMEEVLPLRAKKRAMNLLQSRSYTTEQLRQKLRQGFYPEETIESALQYVASFRYTDDLQYAVDYITYNENRKSRLRIEQDLMRKGIPSDVLESAWMRWQELGGVMEEENMIRDLLAKKNFHPETADYKEKQKIFAFLMRKGFAAEQIRRVMGDLTE